MPENKIERNLPGFYARDEHLVKVKVTDTENPKNIKVFYVPKGTTFKGNTVEAKFDVDTEIKMAKYQMAAMEAAAEGDRFGGSESRIIDLYDSTGAAYGFDVTEKLMEYGSNYKVSRNPNYDGKGFVADATEYGLFFAQFEDKNGNTGSFELQLPKDSRK